MDNLSPEQEKLLAAYALLTSEQQEIVLEAIQIYASKHDRGIPAGTDQPQQ